LRYTSIKKKSVRKICPLAFITIAMLAILFFLAGPSDNMTTSASASSDTQVSFSIPERVGAYQCNWYDPQENNHVNGYNYSYATQTIGNEGYITSINFNLDSQFYYDDQIILTINDVVIFSTTYRLWDDFQTSGNLKIFNDINSIKGKEAHSKDTGRCIGDRNEGPGCQIPRSQTTGTLSVSIPQSVQVELNDYIGGNDLIIKVTSTGDNDPEIDCVHRSISGNVVFGKPAVDVNIPNHCSDSATFAIKGTDYSSANNITSFWLKLNDKTCGPWNIIGNDVYLFGTCDLDVALESGLLWVNKCRDCALTKSGRTATLNLPVNNLEEFDGKVDVYAKVGDINGVESSWLHKGHFVTGVGPVVSINSATFSGGGDDLNVQYNIISNYSEVAAHDCKVKWEGSGGSSGEKNISCSGNTVYINNLDPGQEYKVKVCATTCEESCSDMEIGPPWLMTAYGDAYVFDGFDNLLMQSVTGNYSVANGQAYFSTYLISKSGGSWAGPTGFASRQGYLLSGYDDSNRMKVGSGSGYDYLSRIAKVNDSSYVEFSTLPASCQSGKHVYFIDNEGSSITLGSGWLKQKADTDRACVIITNGSISVPAGVNDPDEIDAFFVADGQFITQSDKETLIINGGVVANEVIFRRVLDENSINPAEIIRYDPKYVVLLKEALGESYPFRIREYKFSE
jgi:hypothetical protein